MARALQRAERGRVEQGPMMMFMPPPVAKPRPTLAAGAALGGLCARPLNRRSVVLAPMALAALMGPPITRPAAAQPGTAASARDHFPFGPLGSPRALQPWAVTTHQGQATDLPALLKGRVTALQLMFTGCGATCPLQGALFAQAQRELGARGSRVGGLQLVSLSIDALGDTPELLRRWLTRFDAQPGWAAAVPRVADVDAIIERLGSGGERRPDGPDPHTGQVYLFNRSAQLVSRTPSLPRPAHIVDALLHVAAAR
jgi:protein SCO1